MAAAGIRHAPLVLNAGQLHLQQCSWCLELWTSHRQRPLLCLGPHAWSCSLVHNSSCSVSWQLKLTYICCICTGGWTLAALG